MRTFLARTLLLVATLTTVAIPLAALETPPAVVTPVTPQATTAEPMLHAQVDRAAINSWLNAEPFAVIRDARAATAARHIETQLRMLDHQDHMPPIFALLFDGQALVYDSWMSLPRQQWDFTPAMRAQVDAGPVAESFMAFIEKTLGQHSESASAAGYTGIKTNEVFIGRDQSSLLMATRDHETVGRPAAKPNDARMHLDLRELAKLLIDNLDPEQRPWLDKILSRGWEAMAPVVTTTIAPEAGVFASRTTVTGLPKDVTGLVPIQPALAAVIPADAQFAFAWGVDPAHMLKQAEGFKNLPRALATELPEVMRTLINGLSSASDGQIAIYGGWSGGPIPGVTMVAGLTAKADIETLVSTGLADLAPTPTTVTGADKAWTATLPIGPIIYIATTANHLVVATDQAEAEAALAHAAGKVVNPTPAHIPKDAGTWLRVDTKVIARQWLPLAWQMLGGMNHNLGRDPLSPLQDMLWNLKPDELDHESVATALIGKEEDANDSTRLNQTLLSLCGDRAGIDASIAIWAPDPKAKPAEQADKPDDGQGAMAVPALMNGMDTNRVVLVVRVAEDLWRVISPHNRTEEPVDGKDLAMALDGLVKAVGPANDKLKILAMPAAPSFDKRWLPPLKVVMEHLRPWEVVVTPTATGLTVVERGLPLITTVQVVAANVVAFGAGHLVKEAVESQQKRLHPEMFTAFEHLIRGLQASQNNGNNQKVLKPSDLVGDESGGIDLSKCAALFGDGKTIPKAADLDKLGQWKFDDEQNPMAGAWVIRIDANWAASLSRWGGVAVILAPKNLPERPSLGGGSKPIF